MINKAAFDMMKKGTVVINCARDVLVDEPAILDAIKSGKVAKYVTDFPNTTTAGQEGVIVLPHLGASTEEAEDNCAVMAVKELRNYIENGNIVNSVNYPNCDCGVCTSAGRVTVCHKNVPAIISKLTSVMGDAGINIESMDNKSRGDYAYSVLDTGSAITEDVTAKLSAIDGVIKVITKFSSNNLFWIINNNKCYIIYFGRCEIRFAPAFFLHSSVKCRNRFCLHNSAWRYNIRLS